MRHISLAGPDFLADQLALCIPLRPGGQNKKKKQPSYQPSAAGLLAAARNF